jgi:L,D-peptidoglycan transpeptidase YkuD (ErfK/YbiS/YcfS/YnhG family)
MNADNKKLAGGIVALVLVLVAAALGTWGYTATRPEPYRATPPNGYAGMAEEDKAGRPSTPPPGL